MNRNEWLESALRDIRKLFTSHNRKLPRKILVSFGIPSGSLRSNTIAECWASETSEDGSVQIFISPILTDPVEVLATLTHELIHSYLDNEYGHRAEFQKIAKQIGLVSPWIEAHPGRDLTQYYNGLIKKLGKLKTPAFNGADPVYTNSKSRLLKVHCPTDNYIIRVSKTQLDRARPICPICKEEMQDG